MTKPDNHIVVTLRWSGDENEDPAMTYTGNGLINLLNIKMMLEASLEEVDNLIDDWRSGLTK